MYQEFFGLTKSPFNMTPDPGCVYLTPRHREALAGLCYAILGKRGFMVLTGDAGTGKTTLLARVLQRLPVERIHSSVILNPTLSPGEFLEMMLLGFGVTEIPPSKPQRLMKLQALLLEAESQNRICALIVDEAHKLSPEVLEEIRLLGNLERSDHKLLQILLLGQDELADLLNRPDMRQLKQRISTRFSLKPLGAAEVEEYIRYRWGKASGAGTIPFQLDSMAFVAQYSKGVPRVINSLCDNALLLAFSEGSQTVEAHHIQEACSDLQLLALSGAARKAIPAPAPTSAAVVFDIPNCFREPPPKASLWTRWAGKLGLAANGQQL